mmetsp:Transcript_10860/g.35972  ORF Transcript_10860/g.35972 Transcript_10860/m.35972 type:complete len:303 (-) Transcript_10860:231-1139(-)
MHPLALILLGCPVAVGLLQQSVHVHSFSSTRHAAPLMLLRRAAPPRASRLQLVSTGTTSGMGFTERPPYLLTGLPHPYFRGSLMGWMHRTRIWYGIAAVYLGMAIANGATSPAALSVRILAAAATCANVLISDGYHNGDKRGGEAYTPSAETTWLRWDYMGISSILSTQLWLWSANFGWPGSTRLAGAVSAAASSAVLALAHTVVPRKAGHTAVKLIMAFQFAALLGYLVRALYLLCPAACGVNAIIFWLYLPGLVAYALKWPKHAVFGFHELFHSSVLLGHAASMVLDLRNLITPCLACVL